jgi:DNA-binding transcriptional MerR regulator
MDKSMQPKLYSLKQSAEILGISTNQFHYLTKQLELEPYLRAGDKHAAVLYSPDQLKQLELAMKLRENKYSYSIIKEVLRKVNDKNDLWIINIENTNQFKVCNLDEVPQVVSEIAKRGKKFIGYQIFANQFNKGQKTKELQTA